MSSGVDRELNLLHESPFFEGLDSEHIEHFARRARKETFEFGDQIIKTGRARDGVLRARPGQDRACPSQSLAGDPHQIVRLPVSHTERPEEKLWERFEAYWLRAVEGIPPNFGESRELSI